MTYTNPQYLVETEWLAKHLYDPELRIIEVTSVLTANRSNVAKASSYDKQHIPGAVYLDVAGEYGGFNAPDAEFPLTWPGREQFEQVMGLLGVGNSSHVILYASTVGQQLYSCILWCARAWWVGRNGPHAGHKYEYTVYRMPSLPCSPLIKWMGWRHMHVSLRWHGRIVPCHGRVRR